METEKTYPYKLEAGQAWPDSRSPGGYRSLPLWVYDSVPAGMVPVGSLRDLWIGRPFLFESRLSPGIFLTSYMTERLAPKVAAMLREGHPVYVKTKD